MRHWVTFIMRGLAVCSIALAASAAPRDFQPFQYNSLVDEISYGLDRQIVVPLGFSIQPAVPNGPLPKVDVMLFDDIWWTPSDADKTVWVSSGSKFEFARDLLTNGETNALSWGFSFRKLDGSPVPAITTFSFTNEGIYADPSHADFSNLEIHAIGIWLHGLSYADVTDITGKHFANMAFAGHFVLDATPVPEPVALASAMMISLLLVGRRPRDRRGRFQLN
jgi:hypothetical protein